MSNKTPENKDELVWQVASNAMKRLREKLAKQQQEKADNEKDKGEKNK